ncbi:4565_t:CDS:1, partial [Funneliformis caledonium]
IHTKPGSYITIRQDIYNALILTNSFQRNPFEVLYQISKTAQSTNTQTTTSLSNIPPVSTRSNTPDLLDEEDFNLDLLF